MLETKFWIQGKKTTLNRWMECVMMASFGMGLVCLGVTQWRAFFGFPVALFVGVLIWHLVATASGVALYQTQGQLEVSEQGVKVNGKEKHEFRSVALHCVEVEFRGYRGQAVFRNVKDGSGNIIRFYPEIGITPIVFTFLADSYAQSQLFVKILRSWRVTGVKIVADGIDLV